MSRFNNLHKALSQQSRPETVRELAFAVQKSVMLDNDNARLLISIPAPHRALISETAMAASVNRQFPGVRYLPGSLYRENSKDGSLYGCFVTRKRQTMNMEQASAAGFTQVSDTVFQDPNDDVWTKVGTGDQAYLSINQEEDIASLLGAVRTRAIATASVEVALEEPFDSGNIVLFYDVTREQASTGVAHSSTQVYVEEHHALVEVAAEQAIYVESRNTPPSAETAGVGTADKAQLLEYYRTLFGHHPEYFKRVKEIIAQVMV